MKFIVVGLGIQGKKRLEVAGSDCVATVDKHRSDATYKAVEDVQRELFDGALVCTPDDCKIEILDYLLTHGKHVLVEKPLFAPSENDLYRLQSLAKKMGVACYTAYNHRFEPHFIRMKELIASEKLGPIYSCRMFYGNGTARDVRNSPWRDKDAGVLSDLGSHLLDTVLFFFGSHLEGFRRVHCDNFENKSPDHILITSSHPIRIDLEMTLLSWRNHFTCDLVGERGSVHIESLCKWGPSKFILRQRKLPSGRPNEEIITLIQPNPTWAAEYRYFKQLCKTGGSNIDNDVEINAVLQTLTEEVLV